MEDNIPEALEKLKGQVIKEAYDDMAEEGTFVLIFESGLTVVFSHDTLLGKTTIDLGEK